MQKIITLFKRNPEDMKHVLLEYAINPVSIVTATEKVDGTNVRVTVRSGNGVRLENAIILPMPRKRWA